MKSSKVMIAVATLLASFAVSAETLEIAGSTTVQKRIIEPAVEAIKGATGVEVKFLGVGTGKGILALMDGKVPVGAASESLEEAVDSAKKAGFAGSVPADLKFFNIMTDNLVVIVQKDNPVRSLTKNQLKDMNTGKIKNWKEVGGPDLAVVVVTSHAGSATRAVFQKAMLDGANYASGAIEVKTTREEVNQVGNNPGGIGAVSEEFYDQNKSKVAVVKAPPISRPLGLITKGEPSATAKKVLDFLKTDAAKKVFQ